MAKTTAAMEQTKTKSSAKETSMNVFSKTEIAGKFASTPETVIIADVKKASR